MALLYHEANRRARVGRGLTEDVGAQRLHCIVGGDGEPHGTAGSMAACADASIETKTDPADGHAHRARRSVQDSEGQSHRPNQRMVTNCSDQATDSTQGEG